MDAYKKKLRDALADYEKENGGDAFEHGKDDSYQFMADMDALSLGLDERGALQFAISYTRQGVNADPYLEISYWSKEIGHQISFGEHMPNIENADQFIQWASDTRKEIEQLEGRLKCIAVIEKIKDCNNCHYQPCEKHDTI